jgi:peptide/nickel transport system substrate-binding protein
MQLNPRPGHGKPIRLSSRSTARLIGSHLTSRRGLGAGLAALAASVLIAACGGAGGTAAGSGTAAPGGAGGTVNWEWELPTSWDPVTSSAGWDMHALGLVYAAITTLDPSGDVGPGLARTWAYAADGKSVTFQLRSGLTFTDGTPLDAAAVKANIERGQKQANSNIASELSVIKSVVVNSPASFTLNLALVDYQVPDLLAGKDGMLVSPAAFSHVTTIPTQPAGAGPFKLTSYVPDSHASLVRNPGYWDASQIHLASFSIQAISQPEQILAALQSGQVNVAYIAGNQVASAKAAGFKIAVIPSEVVNELDVQTTTPPFTSPKVVEAINDAIDRQAIVKVQAAGYGDASYQPFPKGFVGYSPRLASLYPYNPARARQLLAQAGYASGLRITLTSTSSTDALAEQIQGQLAQVGITVTIKDIPADTSTQFLYLKKTIPLAIDGTAGRNSPVEMLDVLYSQQGLMNVTGLATTVPPAVAAALAKALTVPLDSPRYPAALQGAVATAVTQEPIHIWLYTNPRIFAYSPAVTGIPRDLVQQRWEGVQVASS